MEALFLTCVVVAFFVTKGRTDTAAYSNGKEPPGLVRARMRHDRGGGARTGSGRPVGRGAFGLLVASRWASACRAAQHRGEHRAARRRAWFDETAPQRDARWREAQRRRLDRADRARERWAAARGLTVTATGTDDPGGTGGAGGGTDDSGGGRLWPNRARRSATRPPTDTPDTPDTGAVPGATTDTDTGAGGADEGADQHERPAVTDVADVTDVTGGEGRARAGVTGTTETAGTAGTAEPDTGGAADPAVVSGLSDGSVSTPRKGSTEMDEQYEAAVARLTAAAEEIAAFAANLAGFTDRLSGEGWGVEVTGPLAECGPVLSAWEASYRDTAAAMKAQGDAGRAAYDQAPFVPGHHAVLT